MGWNDPAFSLASKSISNNLNHGKEMPDLGLLEGLEACSCPPCRHYIRTYELGAGSPTGREQGRAGSIPQTIQLWCKYLGNQTRVDQPPKSRRGGKEKPKNANFGCFNNASQSNVRTCSRWAHTGKTQNLPHISIHRSSFQSPREKGDLEIKSVFYLNLLEKLSSSLCYTPLIFDAMT